MRRLDRRTAVQCLTSGLVSGALVLAAGCSGKGSVDAGVDPARYAVYFINYPFGGHRVEWWEERLTELSPRGGKPDPALYALTVERAQRNGLVIEEKDGAIIVTPNAELVQRLMARLDVLPGKPAAADGGAP